MEIVLEQAQQAAQQANWSSLNGYLQQLLHGQTALDEVHRPTLLELALTALETGDFHQRWDLAKVFPLLGESAIPPLIDLLEDEDVDWELRWFASRILGQFNHPQAIAVLVNLLKTSDSEDLIAVAATALTHLGTPAIETLTELLMHEKTRKVALRSLCAIGTAQTIVPLLSLAKNADSSSRAAVIEALSQYRDPRITSVLIEALTDPAVLVRQAAVAALGLRSDLLDQFNLVNLLRDRLWDINLEVSVAAAIALGRLRTPEAATALFKLLQSPLTPTQLQVEAVRALGWIGTTEALDYLQQTSSAVPVEVALEIVTVLGRVDRPESISLAAQILIELLRSPHPTAQNARIKQALALSLGQLGEIQALDPLIQLLADSDLRVQLHAIAALRQLAPQQGRQRLEQLAGAELPSALASGIAIAIAEWDR